VGGFFSHVRGIARAAGFLVWTLGVGGAWLIVERLPRERHARGSALVMHVWSRGLCALLGIRVTAQGSPRTAPARAPVLIAANHIGYLDVIILASISPALFVSKSELAGWPVLGKLARSVDTLFLDRNRARAVTEVAAGMVGHFAAGERVILFPEGTTTQGNTVGPFHSALFEPALRAGVPVQGAALRYAPRSSADPADMAAWVGDASFVPHLYSLFRGGGLAVAVTFQEERVPATDRRETAEAVRAWIVDTLEGTEGVDGVSMERPSRVYRKYRNTVSETTPVSWAPARTAAGASGMATARPAPRSKGRSLAESPMATASETV
jgi:1-acyl-sn-glycerol-3-phosphate acyltransferase